MVEIAVAVVILGLLLGSAVLMLGAQIDLKNANETRRILESTRDAIYGFAVTNGRLPCPAATGGMGQETIDPMSNNCSSRLNGFVPALTLGLTPTDANGYLVDAWGNRVRYAVTTDNSFSTSNAAAQLSSLGIATLALRPTAPNGLTVCNISTAEGAGSCALNTEVADQVVAMLHSAGRNGPGGASADEQNNIDNGRIFLERAPSTTFDDQLLWISRYTLYNRMLAAGAL